jgi:cysteine-rich repeat protein
MMNGSLLFKKMENHMRCVRTIGSCLIVVFVFSSALLLQGQQGPVRIEVTPANILLAPAATQQFDAFRLDLGALNKAGGRTKITGLATWISDNQGVATVNPSSGLVTAVRGGACRIIASSGPFRGSALLHVTGPSCGDGILQKPFEQCDDGNNANLDGCSSTCKFEQNQRINSLQMQLGATTDAFCTANALGGAIVGALARNGLQNAINTDVGNGSISLLFVMLGITDLSGTTELNFNMGVVTGAPTTTSGYNGASDLDWWYNPDPGAIDSNRIPANRLSTSISGNALLTIPGRVTLPFVGANLSLSNAKIKAMTSGFSAPTASAGSPPGHLSSEHLDAALMSYPSMGTGELCGGVSAASLAATPAPALAANCTTPYGVGNSLLDVIVGGCSAPIVGTEITATQPDTFDPNAPAAGAGSPYTLAENASHQVSTCKDNLNNAVPLAACLNAAAYSSFFKFTADRVIIK